MADFLRAHKKTAANEAGYANDPVDKGGETWAGVTRRDWPKWPGWATVDAAKAKLGLTNATAHAYRKALDAVLHQDAALAANVADFYKKEYWDTLDLDTEPSQAVAEKVHDIAVNMGVGVAKKFLVNARTDA